MDDLISRQMAIDAIEKCEHHPLFVTKKIKEGIVDFLGLGIGYWDIKDAIEQLPSAQPSYTDEQIQKMQELEQAEIEKAFQLGVEDARSEIIRCKDCRYYEYAYNRIPIEQEWICSMSGEAVPDNMNFCSWAERRTDG